MRVFEGVSECGKALIGIENKYLRVCTQKRTISLNDISYLEASNDSIKFIFNNTAVIVSGLSKEEIQQIEDTYKTKRMITKAEVQTVLKRDIQLQRTYLNLKEEERPLFYKVFADRLLNEVSLSEIDQLENLSSRKRAQFVLSNPQALKAFFQLNLPFTEFVSQLFSGYILMNQEKNLVDKAIQSILSRGGEMDRLNIYSCLLESAWEDTSKIIQVSDTLSFSGAPLNPSITECISAESTLPNREEEREAFNENRTETENKDVETIPNPFYSLSQPERILQAPIIQINQVPGEQRLTIPPSLLKRLRETSRLIFKSKEHPESIQNLIHTIEQTFKEETKRILTPEEWSLALSSIHRISPSRFLKITKEASNQ
ncbi:hypothetical protein NEOKW01_2075 [Nematocida sp. AWRm80]|nr:hypothetical protein NEOKW01_2075 [Nematocida sp. AWRm80]